MEVLKVVRQCTSQWRKGLCLASTQKYDEVEQDKDLHDSDLIWLTSVTVTQASATRETIGRLDLLGHSTVGTVGALR